MEQEWRREWERRISYSHHIIHEWAVQNFRSMGLDPLQMPPLEPPPKWQMHDREVALGRNFPSPFGGFFVVRTLFYRDKKNGTTSATWRTENTSIVPSMDLTVVELHAAESNGIARFRMLDGICLRMCNYVSQLEYGTNYLEALIICETKIYDPFVVFEGIGSCRGYEFGATMAVLYRFMGGTARQKMKSIGGSNFVWDVFEDGRLRIPGTPQTSILSIELLEDGDALCLINGIPLEKFIPSVPEFRTYKEFIENRLMGPLTPI
ncbi:hypothetical protein M9H77_23159 [Catharanthus roseus]|uniref:Uncharacterized protein n=1 Tax=Catharanthus roseus TaxID=4058 RepID=A0ACC0ASX6_CATRO|nr:hypothetical protein M9H77_23159 [Catharanthus roseus]